MARARRTGEGNGVGGRCSASKSEGEGGKGGQCGRRESGAGRKRRNQPGHSVAFPAATATWMEEGEGARRWSEGWDGRLKRLLQCKTTNHVTVARLRRHDRKGGRGGEKMDRWMDGLRCGFKAVGRSSGRSRYSLGTHSSASPWVLLPR
ncbi:hypothetical protein BO70DRAFT_210704 [Aspergillus heteromorphus CBS 117.55]|uniref:Uncharacterized protein n=1 Tax=Aspergillus heteromorphus CBS 117.55 TaxID=1448321 RepID=A0A317WLA9_9EURO|nr:uncharacterized protein BO70DRAFT_210704 [Aspergillus heteromorphus CBS 117.55]PWY86795.1 hypothetical protein BO70DRAFT_210704 [Aspergillus heteromorphus CBS 117.55]